MPATIVNYPTALRKDQSGDRVDILNDTGATLTAGATLGINNLQGVVTKEAANGESTNLECPSILAVYQAPLDPLAANDYQIGVYVDWDDTNDVVVPVTTGDATLNAITLPKCDPIDGVDSGPGISDDEGAAKAGDTWIRIGIVGVAHRSIIDAVV